MDPQRSVTRIGIGADTESRADAPAIRRVVEGLRLDLSQAANLDGAEVTGATTKQRRKRDAWLLAMHQEPGQGGRNLAESCIALIAASSGALDATIDAGGLAGTNEGTRIVKELLHHVTSTASEAAKSIEDTNDITPEVKAQIVSAIQSFFA
jgi:F0F1-type ATP synthase alpha subunit